MVGDEGRIGDQRLNSMSSSPPASPTQRVLIVDDEPALLDALRTALRRAGCDVTACRTFEDAREQLVTDDFDVLVTDVRLGAFNGIQLAVIARDKSPTMRIIVFSGYDDPVLRDEAARLGGTYLLKPVTAEMLLEQIA
jgi:DNA-binding NtrC family response regulator